MSSLYIHIPFCKSRCHYCDFYKEIYRPDGDNYFRALEREMEYRQPYLTDSVVETIYFGGGTPSVYHPARLQRIIDKARTLWEIDPGAEITAEVNPDDATEEYLEALARTDVGRISFGIQSFIDRDLKLMGRRHNSEQAIEAVLKARAAGFRNISVDLIYGIPGMTSVEWEKNVLRALALGADHISTYAMTVEEGTAMSSMIDAGVLTAPDDDDCEEQFVITQNILSDAGFDHYEISNFARDPWFRSRHNSNYWCGDGYLGLGPSAHSYNGKSRSSVVSCVDRYINLAGTNAIYETELLSKSDRYNEYVMVSLRTSTGVQRDRMTRLFGFESLLLFEYEANRLMDRGLIVREGNEYRIPPDRYMIADAIIREFFIEEEE